MAMASTYLKFVEVEHLNEPKLAIIVSATRQQRENFLKIKEPFVKASWERYVKNLTKEAAQK